MIRACDGHRGHGEGGCGFSTSTWPGGECPMCGGEMVDRAPPAPPAPRRPVAGWKRPRSSRWTLDAGYLRATVDVLSDGRIVWRVSYFTDDAEHVKASGADGVTYSVTTASLAAEDALLAVLTDAAAVIGKRVVS